MNYIECHLVVIPMPFWSIPTQAIVSRYPVESNYLQSENKGKDEVSFCLDSHQNKFTTAGTESIKAGAQFYIRIV